MNKNLNYTHREQLLNILDKYRKIQNDSEKRIVDNIVDDECNRAAKCDSHYWGMTKSNRNYMQYLKMFKSIQIGETKRIEYIKKEIVADSNNTFTFTFLCQELSVWPSIQSVYMAAAKDEEIIAKVIYLPFLNNNYIDDEHNQFDEYKEIIDDVLKYDEYNISEDSPDVVFIQKPYNTIPEKYWVSSIYKIIPRIVYIAYGLELTTDLIKYGFQYFGHYIAWKHVVYGDVVKKYARQYGYRNGENIAIWGHPKADNYIQSELDKIMLPLEWVKKAKGRKVILWTPHHLIDLNDNNSTGTWLLWKDLIFNNFFNNNELVLLFRPHPLLFGNLISKGYEDQCSIAKLKSKIDNSDNIILDEYKDYRIAFKFSNAIITDSTSFCFEYLYTGKPEMVTFRNKDNIYYSKLFFDAVYSAESEQEIIDYMRLILKEQDPKKIVRSEFTKHLFFTPNNMTVGENIIRNIKKEIVREVKAIE